MKSHNVPRCPRHVVTHPLARRLHSVHVPMLSHVVAGLSDRVSGRHSVCTQVTLVLLIGPKAQEQ